MDVKIETGHKPPRKRRIPERVRKAVLEYKHAYMAVYHLRPTVSYFPTTGWFKILGMPERVKLRRLKELTTQLERRAQT